jgi:ankyrin repeat protein
MPFFSYYRGNDAVEITQRHDPSDPVPSETNQRLIHFAARGNTSEVRRCINVYGADVHYEDDWALSIAAGRGHTETVRALVQELGADVHAREDVALRQAAFSGQTETVETLVKELGADVHARDEHGCRPYNDALMGGHTDICDFLKQEMALRPKPNPLSGLSKLCRLFR